MTNQNEIIVYKGENALELKVHVYTESVWLSQVQIAALFGVQKAAVSKHMKNIFATGELLRDRVVSKMETTASDGKNYWVDYYNLDMILSVGYRVNSANATRFRQWANNVLKDYLLKGYVFNQRFERIEHRLANVEERQNAFDIEIHADLPPIQGVFFEGQVFSARKFVEDLVREAKKEIVVIDTYVDSSVLDILNERAIGVKATIYTDTISKVLIQDVELNYKQTGKRVDLKQYKMNFHDRFLAIDDNLYHFGAPLRFVRVASLLSLLLMVSGNTWGIGL